MLQRSHSGSTQPQAQVSAPAASITGSLADMKPSGHARGGCIGIPDRITIGPCHGASNGGTDVWLPQSPTLVVSSTEPDEPDDVEVGLLVASTSPLGLVGEVSLPVVLVVGVVFAVSEPV